MNKAPREFWALIRGHKGVGEQAITINWAEYDKNSVYADGKNKPDARDKIIKVREVLRKKSKKSKKKANGA